MNFWSASVKFDAILRRSVCTDTSLGQVYAAPTACFIYNAAHDGGSVCRLLRYRALYSTGEWSYCTYLSQGPIMLGLLWCLNPEKISEIYDMILARAAGLRETNAPVLPVYTLPGVLLLVHFAGGICYNYFEIPILAWLTRE